MRKKAQSFEGRKADEGKARMDLLPPELLTEVAKVLTFGAGKYEERNWEKGMDWSRPYAAALRHMNAWWAGQNLDEETGLSHLAHAICNLAFLLAYEQRNIGRDTRNPISQKEEQTYEDALADDHITDHLNAYTWYYRGPHR